MALRLQRDSRVRITSGRTGELLAEVVVPRNGEPQVRGQYAGTLRVAQKLDGVNVDGYLEDSEGRIFAWRDGTPDYAAAAPVDMEVGRADGGNPKVIEVRPTEEQP